MSKLKSYVMEALEPTLLYATLCSLVGITVASRYYGINVVTAILLIIGVFFAQMAVNVLDDYVDYKRGIDLETEKTAFSGGSKMIVGGLLNPKEVLSIGITAFAIAASIGIYMILIQPAIIPLVVVGAISIVLYAYYFVNVPYLAEPLVAINFILIALGSFVVLSPSFAHIGAAFLVSFPAGSVCGLALLINSIPDKTVDEKHGRKSVAVMIRSKAGTAAYYIAWGIACYAFIAYGAMTFMLPYTLLMVIAASPLMVFSYVGISRYSEAKEMEKYMGANAIHSLLVLLLLIIGYAIVIL